MKISGLLIELAFWVTALCLLAFADLDSTPHLSLCPLANSGWHWCPGCGFGRSLIAILHGNFIRSLDYHWFGLPGMLILFHRIVSLSMKIKVTFLSKSVI
ncbi:DUF2752 domain-containing protein [Arcticibacter pallidicorallinus]|uniref:DUF2752 domain-containing protein n=1 Tax=Arcticibacter pallidicorallinus TaxID=1259464 RepID=UPI000D06F98C|nr:DUF2752 domain-containing protein [Arcticibacter pallidicorallinus]